MIFPKGLLKESIKCTEAGFRLVPREPCKLAVCSRWPFLKALHNYKSNRLVLEPGALLPLSWGLSCCCPTCRALWDLLRSPYQPGTASETKQNQPTEPPQPKKPTHNPQSQAAETYANRDPPKKKIELIKYILPIHYEIHLPSEWYANLNFYFGSGDLVRMKVAACVGEQPPADVCTHLLFLSFLFWVSDPNRVVGEGAGSTQLIFFFSVPWRFELNSLLSRWRNKRINAAADTGGLSRQGRLIWYSCRSDAFRSPSLLPINGAVFCWCCVVEKQLWGLSAHLWHQSSYFQARALCFKCCRKKSSVANHMCVRNRITAPWGKVLLGPGPADTNRLLSNPPTACGLINILSHLWCLHLLVMPHMMWLCVPWVISLLYRNTHPFLNLYWLLFLSTKCAKFKKEKSITKVRKLLWVYCISNF